MPNHGEILGGIYQVVDQIGSGGAGIIYRAYHLNLHKYVVVKKIKDNYVGSFNARGEVDILKSLHHTCLPQVYDFLWIGNDIYTVMDYINGYDLKYYIDQNYQFDEETLWKWLEQLVDVLDYLHSHRILHMDIKPANIMLTEEGNVCLIDFNISLSDDSVDITGISTTYASPEQLKKWIGVVYKTEDAHIKLDSRTDIYSLGATFYHMMTHSKPTPYLEQRIEIENYALPYSENLVKIISRMMSANQANRYRSAAKVKQAIAFTLRGKKEKRTLTLVFGSMLAAVIVLVIALSIIFYRQNGLVSQKNLKVIQREEIVLSNKYNSGDYQDVCHEAIHFMNLYDSDLHKLKGSRERFLQLCVESYIAMEDYISAKQYIEEILSISNKVIYYVDAAVIEANLHNYDLAEQYIDVVRKSEGTSVEIERCNAEIKVAQGNYQQAIDIYQQLFHGNKDISLLRRIAALQLRLSQSYDNAIDSGNSLLLAINAYEQLVESGYATYVDKMNLVTAYEIGNQNEKAVSMLQIMTVDYPNQYQPYLQLGILKYNMELNKIPKDRDFTKVKEYAKKANEIYSKTVNGQQDEQLNNLRELVEGL